MTARITIERILRDDDDATGQSVRQWRIEAEAACVTVRAETAGFLMVRAGDIDLLIEDLNRAKAESQRLQAEARP